jgi:hypothetical protein
MANQRGYTDDQLRAAVATAYCWADVMEAIGKSRSWGSGEVQKAIARLSLDTSHFIPYVRSRERVAAPGSEFTRQPSPGSRSGLSVAAKWFLDRGYIASIPLEVAHYDLVVESDNGLKRVQVKTTGQLDKKGRFVASIHRRAYDPTAPVNARGRVRSVCYAPDEVDILFIVTAAGDLYLVPISAVEGLKYLTLSEKYENFRVS